MPTLTVDKYYEKLALPMYTAISTQEHMHIEQNEVYDVRLEIERREEYVHLHKALLLGDMVAHSVEDIPNILIAFNYETRDEDEALEKLRKYVEADRKIQVLVFLRLDRVKEFVLQGREAITTGDIEQATKEDTQ